MFRLAQARRLPVFFLFDFLLLAGFFLRFGIDDALGGLGQLFILV